MAEGCPARTALEAFAADDTPGCPRDELEAHLSLCLACAEQIDAITCARLEELIGPQLPRLADLEAANSVLAMIMRKATDAGGPTARIDPDDILATLDAPLVKGALGSFAGYDILEVIGRGGMGVVFKGRDQTLDRFVAIKVIPPVGESEDPEATRFLEEARAVAAIQHDHIVAVHHAGVANGLSYLVMPFHSEGTLEAQLERTPKLAPDHVARVGLQLARALTATHARGILHRDLKPSNVLLENSGERVRLADFGLARTRDPRDIGPGAGSRSIAGTPHYMSPEQARGEAIDARSDLFSLGAVLFQMATGQGLYSGASPEDVIHAAARCEIKSARAAAPELPRALAAVIDRLLAKRPEDRFESAATVASELERILEPGGWAWRWMKRAAVVLVICLAALSSIVVLDASGRTAVINSIWCQGTGNSYLVRGRFGTYASISEAIAGARPHDVIEVRFSGERATESFRLGGKPLTIRAARGYMPILVAANDARPLILVDAPLTLEGLTLWRRGPNTNFAPLASVENASLHLLNCRVLRSSHQGEDIVVRGQLQLSTGGEARRNRPLLAFQHGSSGVIQNCVVAGTAASSVSLRSTAGLPTHVEFNNSLIVADFGIHLNAESEGGASISAAGSVFVTRILLNASRPTRLKDLEVSWRNSVLDRTQGGNLVYPGGYDWERTLRAIRWSEGNVVYAGRGGYANIRKGTALSGEEWRDVMQLKTNGQHVVNGQAFPQTCFRSCLTLSATDLDESVIKLSVLGDRPPGAPTIGPGAEYDHFRRSPAYREWQRKVRASVHGPHISPRGKAATPSD